MGEGAPLSVVALVPAAGRGDRLGGPLPKALVPLGGCPLLVHAVRGLLAAGCVDAVVVAAPPGHLEDAGVLLAPLGARVLVVAGGADRTSSVRRALAEAGDAEVVLVHDAARCLVPAAVVRSVVGAVRAGAPAVVPVLPVADTLKLVDPAGTVLSTVDREALRAVQTPQGFAADVLRRAYAEAAGPATDDAGLVEALGVPVRTVLGHPDAFKITTAADLVLAELLLGNR